VKIVADVDLPFLDEMFSDDARVVRLKASGITAETVRDADAVIVRSVTKVDESLLDGSSVRFVGTATIGTDHVDTAWLASRGVAFASAPGCNANAVSEYLTAALFELSARFGFRIRGSTIGVVGVGNVGSRVVAKAAALGMEVLLNDPPLARSTGSARYLPIDDLMGCDIVTLHVPLTRTGPDATHHLFGAERISALKRGAVLINTARGAAVDTPALVEALGGGHLRAAVVDVWEGEPSVDPTLLSRAEIATPHIAGYSNDGKANASMMMYDALCAHFGWERKWRLGDRLPAPETPVIAVDAGSAVPDPGETIRRIVRTAYPIRRDDAAMRLVAGLPQGEKPGYFLRLRNEYPLRREFHATTVRRGGSPGFPESELSGLGFRIV
jgi:erythronate-4-phosphate dehydrogenase